MSQAAEAREPSSEPFAAALERHGLALCREATTTLQVNVGPLCNQSCRHCHLEAGPSRNEAMGPETMAEVIAYARRGGFRAIDVTGGAPELVPGIAEFLESLASGAQRLLWRTNLTALAGADHAGLLDLFARLRVVLVGSLPSINPSQADAARGAGTWERSLATLRELNRRGWGTPGSGLELDLVSNPVGAFMPAPQCETERRFRQVLGEAGVAFGRLYSFANVPLGRFRTWLVASGNHDAYLAKLAEGFNPAAVAGLMCRSLVSVSWDGYLHDCDFNLAAGLPLGGARRHVSGESGAPLAGAPIATGEHCYACTAGAGFT